MKKRDFLLAGSLTAAVLLLTILIYFSTKPQIFFAPPAIPIPENCTDESIKAVWDSIFQEPSSGITIFNGTELQRRCGSFLAYKNLDDIVFMISGLYVNTTNEPDKTSIYAIKVNATNNYLQKILDIDSVSNITLLSFNIQDINNRSINITQAESEFTSAFRATPATLLTIDGARTKYSFSESSVTTRSRLVIGLIEANYTAQAINFSDWPAPASCIPNWTAVNGSCNSDDRINIWYNDTNSCNNQANMPANITSDCDYLNRGVIGDVSSATTSYFELSIYIDDEEINYTKKYNTTLVVELLDDSSTNAYFSYSFSKPLNLRNVYIKKQSGSSSLGYLLVKGINASKTFFVDKLNNASTRVCIKDSEFTSISDMSDECEEDDENILVCPGSSSGFNCSISNNKFKVSGLKNSAVREFIPSSFSYCTASWSCTNWTACLNSNRTRTCTDINMCNTTIGKPAIKESCFTAPPAQCTASWTCTSWSPSSCQAPNNQTRTCSDANKCNVTTNKPSEKQTCILGKADTGDTTKMLFYVVIGILVFGILAVAGVIIYVLAKNRGEKRELPNPAYNPNKPLVRQ